MGKVSCRNGDHSELVGDVKDHRRAMGCLLRYIFGVILKSGACADSLPPLAFTRARHTTVSIDTLMTDKYTNTSYHEGSCGLGNFK